METYTPEVTDSDTTEYNARVIALVEEGMKPYDARVRAQKEDFDRKKMIVPCIKFGDGIACYTNCGFFEECWVKGSQLETAATSSEKT